MKRNTGFIRNSRSANEAEIEKDSQNIKFSVDNYQVVFSEGEIFVVSEESIVEKATVSEFNRRPAQTFRMLQYAMETGKKI